jgi:NAD(P)-dependent dehydrogenase (short-subunit alcohol dehydrogenase family)
MEAVKTIIITGAGGHLGRRVAHWWATPHARLVLIDRDAGRLDKTRADLAASGAETIILTLDATKPEDLAKGAAALPEALWRTPPSLIVAHGLAGKGIGGKAPRLSELDHARWREILDANLSSVVFAIDTFVPYMKRAGGGRIVLVSSTAGLLASPTAALSYSVAKAGVAALPPLLACELASSGVLINAVAPGKFFNPDWPDEPEKVKRYERSVPLGRLASADEVAALIGFLSSEANTYLTGQTIVQDGGRLSAPPG